MKNKKIFLAAGIAAILAVFGIGVMAGAFFSANQSGLQEQNVVQNTGQDSADQAAPKAPMQGMESQITMEEAKKTACLDLGLSVSEVTFTKEKLDYDDGIALYEIEFFTETQGYEYEIKADTGEIYSKEIEDRKQQNFGSSESQVDMEQAKSIAVSHAGFSVSDVAFTKEKLDSEDGITVYEIEFLKDGMEYEYEIDASSGTILECHSEME